MKKYLVDSVKIISIFLTSGIMLFFSLNCAGVGMTESITENTKPYSVPDPKSTLEQQQAAWNHILLENIDQLVKIYSIDTQHIDQLYQEMITEYHKSKEHTNTEEFRNLISRLLSIQLQTVPPNILITSSSTKFPKDLSGIYLKDTFNEVSLVLNEFLYLLNRKSFTISATGDFFETLKSAIEWLKHKDDNRGIINRSLDAKITVLEQQKKDKQTLVTSKESMSRMFDLYLSAHTSYHTLVILMAIHREWYPSSPIGLEQNHV